MDKCREHIKGYVGPMYSGKTLMLLHEIAAVENAGQKVLVFKPAVDNRYNKDEIRSRLGGNHVATAVTDPCEIVIDIKKGGTKPDVVAIDEAQFFITGKAKISDVVLYLAENGIQVMFSGLNRDFRGEPFGPMRDLMPIATDLVIIKARCTYPINHGSTKRCGGEAQFTQRLINGKPAPYDSPLIVIDRQGQNTAVTYEARCIDHWCVPGMPDRIRF